MYAYLYVESKTGNGFQFIPCKTKDDLESLKDRIESTGLFNCTIFIC